MKILEPGHKYELDNFEQGTEPNQTLQFIQKESKEGGDVEAGELETTVNGTTNEEVLAVLIDRTKFLNEKFPSNFNESALEGLNHALEAFNQRTRERKERGVEGKAVA